MLKNMRTFIVVILVLVFASVLNAADIKVLLITGENNHDWKATTPQLEKMYAESGQFTVELTTDPASLNADKLKNFDVIVSNWTIVGKSGHVWGADTEKAIEDFVASGKGFVTFHAGSSCFADWKGFHEMVGGTWGQGTGHGHYHEFKVEKTEDHPITKGMTDFNISDELWNDIVVLYPVPSRKVILKAFSSKEQNGSGKIEDVAMATNYGKGRGFYTTLGHDARALSDPSLALLMLRATEWAATGKATIISAIEIDVLLQAVAKYDYGQNKSYINVAELVSQKVASDPVASSELAAKYAKMIEQNVSLQCKKFAIWQLSLIGSDQQVKQLAKLLADDQLSDHAANALTRIGTEQASAAIRAELTSLKAAKLAGAIYVLGELQDTKAVKQISSYVKNENTDVARAALTALGNIGGKDALKTLKKSQTKIKAELTLDLWLAQINCADMLAAQGKTKDASKVYSAALEKGLPESIRIAGFIGLCDSKPNKSSDIIVDALKGTDSNLSQAAVTVLRTSVNDTAAAAVAEQLNAYPADVKVTVINALADSGQRVAATAIEKSVNSPDQQIKFAAIEALGKLGEASSVPMLIDLLKTSGQQKDQARTALIMLTGKDVDSKIIKTLDKADPAIKHELITILASRGSTQAVKAIREMVNSDDQAIRQAATKALASIGSVEDLDVLIDALKDAKDTRQAKNIEKAIMSISRRAASTGTAVDTILKGLSRTNDTGQIALLRVLGNLGGEKSLVAITKASKDKKSEVRMTSIRVLAKWSDASPAMALLEAASNADSTPERVVALRGFVKMSNSATDISGEKVVEYFAKILASAENVNEKKELLVPLGQIHSKEALQLLESMLSETEISEDAAAAAINISNIIWRWHKEYVVSVLNKVIEVTKQPAVAEQAKNILANMEDPINFALSATASSPDGLDTDGGSAGDTAANDGNMDTYWDEADGKDLYRYKLTFPENTPITLIKIIGYSHHGYAPKDFDMICDGKVVKNITNAEYDNNVLSITLPKTTCRSIELKITGKYGPSPAMREIGVYNAP